MFNHPELMLDLARQHHDELISQARRYRWSHQKATDAPALPRPRPAPPVPVPAIIATEITDDKPVAPVGTLLVCETPRELTAGRAR